jgi:hypothetical protein
MRLPDFTAGRRPQTQQRPAEPTPDALRAAAQFLAGDRRASEASLSGGTLVPVAEGAAK